jgi:hypothetical protein
MLKKGGALITDVTVEDGKGSKTVWDSILENPGLRYDRITFEGHGPAR